MDITFLGLIKLNPDHRHRKRKQGMKQENPKLIVGINLLFLINAWDITSLCPLHNNLKIIQASFQKTQVRIPKG